MQPIDLAYLADKYGWLFACIVVLVANGDKVVNAIILLMNAFARLLRQGGRDKQAIAKVESALLLAWLLR